MARPIWITPSQTLSTINESEYFEYQLQATNSARYIKTSGELPPGIQLTSLGSIQGIATISNTNTEEKIYSYFFTVRAISVDNLIADRSFRLDVSNIKVPIIIGPAADLGTYTEGDFVNIQLEYVDSTPGESVTFSLISGNLPNSDIDPNSEIYPYRITLSSSGLLSGYILRQPNISQTFNFVVELKDTINSTQKSFSLTTTQLSLAIGESKPPILLTQPTEIVPVKHDNFYSFKFIGYDFDNDPIGYFIDNRISDSTLTGERGFDSTEFDRFGFDQPISNLTDNIQLDPNTGWFYGRLPEVQGVGNYRFNVSVKKTVSPFTNSKNKLFDLIVFSTGEQEVEWITDRDLGEIYNGSISDLSVQAVSINDPAMTVKYRIKPYDTRIPLPVRLPQGLILKDNGLIVGRPSFRYFNLDSNTTTFDRGDTTFDETSIFTVDALDEQGNLLGYKTFQVRVTNRNTRPYENIQIKALSTVEHRSQYFDLIQSREWISDSNVYRPDDPYFGRCSTLQSLFLPGIEPALLLDYIQSTEFNHYRKKLNLTNLKLARALGSNFEPIYEIIYADIEDTLEEDNQSVALEINLLNKLADFYQIDGIDQTVIYPNSFRNMRQRLLEKLDLESRGVLPKWMTSVQENGAVLGFVRAVPLVYCVPGTGKVAIQRLQQKLTTDSSTGFINSFNFEIDRYNVDQYLSRYYDSVTGQFLLGNETTFDSFIDPSSFLSFGGNINYAVDVPFETINNANLFQLLGSSGIQIISPETYDVDFDGNIDNSVPPWSTWMNSHAVWANPERTSLQNTAWSVERDFFVADTGIYQMAIMNTDSVVVSINGSTATSIVGQNITDNFLNYVVNIYLPSGKNNIKSVMSIPPGISGWRFNPKGLAIVIYRTIEVNNIPVVETVFATRNFKDPKITFVSQTLRPGIDQEFRIRTGQKLIFKTQDYYTEYPGLEFDNHGWNRYNELFGINYDREDFNEYSIIPGLGQPVNQRSGVWTITVDANDTVKLEFDQPVAAGTYFRILSGARYGGKLLRLSPLPDDGKTELNYYVVDTTAVSTKTSFDGGATRFLEYRDLYLDPGRNDKYVIYPKLGVFK
jgi:hypothetical protein